MLKEEERPVVDAGQTGTETPAEALLFVLFPYFFVDLLPLHTKWRVRQAIVERAVGVSVFGEAVADGDVGGVLAFEHHVGSADRISLFVEFLAEHFEAGSGVEVAQVVLGDREHSSGAARWVKQGAHGALGGEHVVVFDEQEVHHQLDDFARGEVLSSGLIGEFGESADELFVEITHLEVRDRVGMEVDLGELADHLIQQVCLGELFDLCVEAELFDDVAGALGEASDVGTEVCCDLVGVVEQFGDRELAGVVELLARHLAKDRVDIVDATLHLRESVEHSVFGGFQHAVQAADHREGHDHLAVFRLLVVAPQKVGYRPDESSVILDDRRVRH